MMHKWLIGFGVVWALVAVAQEVRVPDFDPPPPTMKLGAEPVEDNRAVELPTGLPPAPWFRDESGRHWIPNGFVVNTEDVTGDYD